MRIPEILEKLEMFHGGVFPREALQEAIAQREQITPELLKILEYARKNTKELLAVGYMTHIYALYLLAQFREQRAYPLIVDFFSIPGEVTLDVTGDVVTEDLSRILASVCGGDTSLIKSLAENERANEFVRDAALEALLVLAAIGEMSREEVVTYYQSLFAKFERTPSIIWSGLVGCCTDLYPEEVMDDIEQAFDDGLVSKMFIDLEWVRENLAAGKEKALERLKSDRRKTLIDDTIKEMEWWACFRPPEPPRNPLKKKTRRNDPCPCGSGKKYKKCCGARR
ncbi:MAG: DUF1186 domain-containing protein [Chloroflexi bacterium]|nr:MAG: hypothetical protein B6I35_02560 [Anaerolineaceae bacterium 4572_32.2]RLC82254.1 MAG: DUF1186 domain-containing protein [Chloroflexota bacterium]RLC87897.1 MAG: DUF1186 domain-containing protein [Chloroflexota bacterium]HEY73154.1 DUF1186 domain-containing protein [Thermoflexia bacterium]